MLLGDVVLEQVARVWRHREGVEWEAATLFRRLASDLTAVGASHAVIELAVRAGQDEVDHALRCRRLVDRFAPNTPPIERIPVPGLGPSTLDLRERTLYAAVAMSCITETLSSALLLRMRETATDPAVRSTVDAILKDEIDHSRIGWAHLAWEAQRGDVAWLSEHISAMLRGAYGSDLDGMAGPVDARGYGILPPSDVRELAQHTIATVIGPGLALYGIETPSGAESSRGGANRAGVARSSARSRAASSAS